MKNKLYISCIILFLIILLCFPKIAFEGSITGLLLWFHTILPTLLPFIILTGILLKLNFILNITKFFHPVSKNFFHTTEYGSYALLCGLLCGYPMGAKIISDLLKSNRITAKEGQYLLGICNNVSPAFFINYVIIHTLKISKNTFLFVIYLYVIIFIFAFITRPKEIPRTTKENKPATNRLTFEILDSCIMDGFETITRLGGYIILFAIIAKMATALIHTVTILSPFVIGIIELTNGIMALQELSLPARYAIPISFFLCTFGGLCGLAQTKSMISQTPLSIRKYLKTKIILSVLSLIVVYITCIIFNI